jgi:hypothetical protein
MKDDDNTIISISPLEVLALMCLTSQHEHKTIASNATTPTAYRTEVLHKEPCWECSRSLCNVNGKPYPPLVAYVAFIEGFDRKLHRQCAEGLGFKCITKKKGDEEK